MWLAMSSPFRALLLDFGGVVLRTPFELVPAFEELGVTIVPYCPLGRGFLGGNVASADVLPEGDYRRMDPRYSAENYPHNQEILDTLESVAERCSISKAQVALAWLLHNPVVTAPKSYTGSSHAILGAASDTLTNSRRVRRTAICLRCM